MGVPAGEEDVAQPEALDRLDRVLALPLAGIAAEQDEGGAVREAPARPRVGLDQQRQALDLGEAARVEQHRSVQRLEIGLRVGDASRPRPGPPALRTLDQVAAPVGAAVDLARREAGVEAVRGADEAIGIEVEDGRRHAVARGGR